MTQLASSRREELSQQWRLIVAVAYLVCLLLLGIYLNGQVGPPFGLLGVWFYSAFAALILGEFILEPFFTRPADALANGIAVVVGAASVSLDDAAVSADAAEAGRIAFVALGLVIVLTAVAAMTLKDASGKASGVAEWSTDVVGRLGRARVVWSVVLFGAGYAAFADDAGKVAALYVAWVVVFVVEPLERIARFRARRGAVAVTRGEVERVEDPGIAVVRLPPATPVHLGDMVSLGEPSVTGTVVDLTTLVDEPRVRVAVEVDTGISVGSSAALVAGSSGAPIIGHVGDGTTLDELHVETAAQAAATGLAEGRLLVAPIGGRPVLYQVTQAAVYSEREDRFRRDVIKVMARKLGVWDEAKTVFEPAPWLPAPGEPVRLLAAVLPDANAAEVVGRIPRTYYGIHIDLDLAVTHNTAILGILGVGKTRLAWELVRRMLVNGTKVVALDITGQYSEHLSDVHSPGVEESNTKALNEVVAAHLDDDTVRDGQAGNYLDFKKAIAEFLRQFMESDERLLVLNPNRLEVSRMEGKPFSGRANLLVRLTMVEVTQIVAETLLTLVQDDFSQQGRVCLVLEEAHSLVPEWSSTVQDNERAAVNGTARAILQGRKYGFGCLLITQRTANVTKSILNQCNTIFGLRIYDATGMGFLENYVGPAHARLLATLADRHAVVFGRASSCNAPIIVELNDSDRFATDFWSAHRGSIPQTEAIRDEEDETPSPERAE